MSDVGKRLKEEREKKHFTQVQVFKKTGINNKTLSGYENNVSYPDFESLKLLAELYDVTTDYLLGVETKNDSSVEESEMEAMKREIRDIVSKAQTDEDVKSILHIMRKVMKQ